jgi:hypothetical protein
VYNSYLIETDDEIAGIVVRSGQSFRFHALGADFKELELQRFASPWKAERAATLLQRSRRRRPRQRRG